MVSLGRNFNMSSGARFLGGEEGHDDRVPVLSSDINTDFKPLRTGPIFSFHLLISTIISLVGIILASAWPDNKRCEGYFIMLYLRAIFWFITFFCDHLVKHHHEKLRLNGYHEFTRFTAMHRGLPFYLVSLWNTVILLIQALMQHYYGADFPKKCIEHVFSPIVYITLFCILESLLLGAINGTYLAKVHTFNQNKSPPDALRGNYTGNSGTVGLIQPGANTAELLEKQADLINYLKDHNLKLNQKLMQLNAQVRTVTVPTYFSE